MMRTQTVASTTIKREASQGLSLSARQRELLDLLVEGKSNKEIAEELKIESGTVKQHLFVLFRKLGVNSRAKAVIAASQIFKPNVLENTTKRGNTKARAGKSATKTTAKADEGYSWRLVSAVAVSIAELGELKPSAISMRDQFLKSLRETIEKLAGALDGQASFLPGGGSVIWFGHPYAHLDDADRAVFLAQYLQSWAEHYQKTSVSQVSKKNPPMALLGIGLASHTEVVSERATELYGAEAFRKAETLAHHAMALKMPLSDLLTKKIAPMSGAWMEIKSKEGNKKLVVKDVGPIVVVGQNRSMLYDSAAKWGGLPFLDNAFEAINSGLAQWISVESWPPAAATLLIDSVASVVVKKNFQILKLRTPGSHRRDRALASFTSQIEMQFSELLSLSEKIYPSQGERIAGLLAEISKASPLAVLVYGMKALDVFKSVIGEAGIDRLASRQIMIVAANMQDQGSAQISVRILGPKPNIAPFSRVFNLQMPRLDQLPEGIQVDFRALLDGLNSLSRELVIRAASDLETPMLTILSQMNEPHHKVQACIQELTSSGLICASQGGGFEFRDLSTAQAIKQLSIAISNSETAS
ncbi:helix-turn-helix transcriptional regulator [Polynucleobacter sp. MWH-UH25E]|uniref:helix-turn-helix domain-containing protein n=1 Tax=Polynucleobacter sp. MWH-UH25E TaxID=1855616 RepID=UPI001BFDEDCD|nr:LuxR C-terminal-related transcriptional regulator [Polynucleobacter sp. MWH-UH25E]QWD61822.1 response regulator transcription factor [Polynucleobacter sp. MWH-UH25E]